MYSRENASQCIDSRNSVGPASQTEERKRHWVTVVCRRPAVVYFVAPFSLDPVELQLYSFAETGIGPSAH